MSRVNLNRVRTVSYGRGAAGRGPVIYWMSRDQRAEDNWALLHAQDLANERGAPLAAVFCLAPAFPGANLRHYAFMLRGLARTADELKRFRIPLYLLHGEPGREIPRFALKHRASALVADFDPLRIKRRWLQEVAGKLPIPVLEADAHNVVPCWAASHKPEYGAYTLRPKIRAALDEFLEEFPVLEKHPVAWKPAPPGIDADAALERLKPDASVSPVRGIQPGAQAALHALRAFINSGLRRYAVAHNDPNADAASGLSPWLHFGHLSAQRVALEVTKAAHADPELADSAAAFLEQLVVRRELSDNYCLHNPAYDALDNIPSWARATLDAHRADQRDYVYSLAQWEDADTHDPLWNAAQRQLTGSGAMHGYMRMYWGKKILEWSASPEEAMATAVQLNDRLALDGRDPNGYTGIAWCIGGVHDRPWRERPVFGSIRYMNAAGCRRKFDADSYIARWSG